MTVNREFFAMSYSALTRFDVGEHEAALLHPREGAAILAVATTLDKLRFRGTSHPPRPGFVRVCVMPSSGLAWSESTKDEAYRAHLTSEFVTAARLYCILSESGHGEVQDLAAGMLGRRYPAFEAQRRPPLPENVVTLDRYRTMEVKAIGRDVAKRSTEPLPGGRITRSPRLATAVLKAGITIPTGQILFEAGAPATSPWYFPSSKDDNDAMKQKQSVSTPHSFRGCRSTALEVDAGHQGRVSLITKARRAAKRKRNSRAQRADDTQEKDAQVSSEESDDYATAEDSEEGSHGAAESPWCDGEYFY